MVVENDINVIRKIIQGEVIKDIIQNTDGITIIFMDDSKFKIKTFNYQMLIGK